MNRETKLSLLMKSLTEFYKDKTYVEQIQSIVDQNSIVSLRILDWFITNYSKKYRTMISVGDDNLDVYMNYKLMLKSFSKKAFDPFCRKNKILFYYTEQAENGEYIETSCGQLCFFRWCFENKILDYVKSNLTVIEKDMKDSLRVKKVTDPTAGQADADVPKKKRQPLSISAARSISKTNIKYTLKFD